MSLPAEPWFDPEGPPGPDDDYEAEPDYREGTREDAIALVHRLCDEAGMSLEDVLAEGRAGQLWEYRAHMAYWFASLVYDDAGDA